MSDRSEEMLQAIRAISNELKGNARDFGANVALSIAEKRLPPQSAWELVKALSAFLEIGQAAVSIVEVKPQAPDPEAILDDAIPYSRAETTQLLHELKKITDPIFSVIDMISDALPDEATTQPENACLKSAQSQLELALESAGITKISLTNAERSNRQWVLDVRPTSDLAVHGTVASEIRHGYEWRGVVLRPQTVALYKYNGE